MYAVFPFVGAFALRCRHGQGVSGKPGKRLLIAVLSIVVLRRCMSFHVNCFVYLNSSVRYVDRSSPRLCSKSRIGSCPQRHLLNTPHSLTADMQAAMGGATQEAQLICRTGDRWLKITRMANLCPCRGRCSRRWSISGPQHKLV